MKVLGRLWAYPMWGDCFASDEERWLERLDASGTYHGLVVALLTMMESMLTELWGDEDPQWGESSKVKAWRALQLFMEAEVTSELATKVGHHLDDGWRTVIGPLYRKACEVGDIQQDTELRDWLRRYAVEDWLPTYGGVTLDAGCLLPVPHLLRILLSSTPLERGDTSGMWATLVRLSVDVNEKAPDSVFEMTAHVHWRGIGYTSRTAAWWRGGCQETRENEVASGLGVLIVNHLHGAFEVGGKYLEGRVHDGQRVLEAWRSRGAMAGLLGVDLPTLEAMSEAMLPAIDHHGEWHVIF